MNEKIEKLEAALKEAVIHAGGLADDLAHCPSAGALQSRVGNALEMLGSLKREAATLKPPVTSDK